MNYWLKMLFIYWVYFLYLVVKVVGWVDFWKLGWGICRCCFFFVNDGVFWYFLWKYCRWYVRCYIWFFECVLFFCDGDVVCVVVSRWDVYILVVFSVYDIIVFFNKVVGMRRRIIVVVLVVVSRRKRWLL